MPQPPGTQIACQQLFLGTGGGLWVQLFTRKVFPRRLLEGKRSIVSAILELDYWVLDLDPCALKLSRWK